MGGGGGDYIPIAHCHHQNDSCIKMGSDVSHFDVSLIAMDQVTRQVFVCLEDRNERFHCEQHSSQASISSLPICLESLPQLFTSQSRKLTDRSPLCQRRRTKGRELHTSQAPDIILCGRVPLVRDLPCAFHMVCSCFTNLGVLRCSRQSAGLV